MQLSLILLLFGVPDAFGALHLLCNFEVAFSDPSLVQVGMHFLIFALLLDESYLNFLLLVIVDLRLVLLLQLQLVQLLPLLHLLQLLSPGLQVLLYLQFLVLE